MHLFEQVVIGVFEMIVNIAILGTRSWEEGLKFQLGADSLWRVEGERLLVVRDLGICKVAIKFLEHIEELAHFT